MTGPGTADDDKFILVYLEGIGGPILNFPATQEVLSWNSGHRGFGARLAQTDDVAFVDAVLASIVARLDANLLAEDPDNAVAAVNLGQVFLVGHGNGGMLCYRLAHALPWMGSNFTVAAFAVVGASIGGKFHFEDPDIFDNSPHGGPQRTPDASVLVIHGDQDQNVRPPDLLEDGRLSLLWAGLLNINGVAFDRIVPLTPWDYSPTFSANQWVAHLGALPSEVDDGQQINGHPVRIETWLEPLQNHVVALLTQADLAAEWPGPDVWGEAVAARMIWDFFKDPTQDLVP